MSNLNNIYQESKDYHELIVRRDEMDNSIKRVSLRKYLRKVQTLVLHFKVTEIYLSSRYPRCGKLAVNKISEKITEILSKTKLDRMSLLNLYDITLEVHLATEHFPSVQSIIKTDQDRDEYIKTLSYFVARHILIHKYRLNRITNSDMKTIVGDYLDIRNANNGIYIGMHQISNKLIEGDLNPRQAMFKLEEIMWERRTNLAKSNRL